MTYAQKSAIPFAAREEVMSEDFQALIKALNRVNVEYTLDDSTDVNHERYPWAEGLLESPEMYAARLWEYPYAILSARLKPGMRCVDIGCGMTAFTIYLKEVALCDVVGADPDLFESGIREKAHGVSREFIRNTGLHVVRCGMEKINLSSNSCDRVFCLSVIEHLERATIYQGIREMVRILKPGGLLVLTADVNIHLDICRPMDLIWYSGCIPNGPVDLHWPVSRFVIFCEGKQPADVIGMTLLKEEHHVESQYGMASGVERLPVIEHSQVPELREPEQKSSRDLSALLRKDFTLLLKKIRSYPPALFLRHVARHVFKKVRARIEILMKGGNS